MNGASQRLHQRHPSATSQSLRKYQQNMAQNDDAKRANTAITIAQLKFKQNLKREEPEARLPPLPVDTCSQLFSAIDAVLAQDTPVNIQVSDCNTTTGLWS